MRVAHLILAHQQAPQVARLARRLLAADEAVFLHLDARIDPSPFLALLDPRVRFLGRRHASPWGTYGLVAAALELLRAALADRSVDYLSLLSGSDYPLRPLSALHTHLDAHPGREHFSPILSMADNPRFQRRYQRFWFGGRRHGISGQLESLLHRLPWIRTLPDGLVPHCGSQWWTLTRNCAAWLVDRLDRSPELVRFFRHVMIPDELVFPTLLASSPFTAKITGENLRCIEFPPELRHPRVWRRSDLPRLLGETAFFARKFDSETDSAVLDLLDAHLDAPGHPHADHPYTPPVIACFLSSSTTATTKPPSR